MNTQYPPSLDITMIICALACVGAVIVYHGAVFVQGSDRFRRWTVVEAQLIAGIAVAWPVFRYGLDDTVRSLLNFGEIGLFGWVICVCYLVLGIGSPGLSALAFHRILRDPSFAPIPASARQSLAVVVPFPVGRARSD